MTLNPRDMLIDWRSQDFYIGLDFSQPYVPAIIAGIKAKYAESGKLTREVFREIVVAAAGHEEARRLIERSRGAI